MIFKSRSFLQANLFLLHKSYDIGPAGFANGIKPVDPFGDILRINGELVVSCIDRKCLLHDHTAGNIRTYQLSL